MIDNRFVCLYPQYKYCGKKSCPLSKYCSSFPKIKNRKITDDLRTIKKSPIIKSEEEKKEHIRLYNFYNTIFGDLKQRNIIRNRRWYKKHRKEILARKRKPTSYKLPIVYTCEYECEECPYPDCTLKLYENKKEYMELYYDKFHDKINKQKAEYRENNRAYLSNSEKLRNYRQKRHRMENCYLLKTDTKDSSYAPFIGTMGTLCFLPINCKPYFSYITADRQKSFRGKILNVIEDSKENIVLQTNEGTFLWKRDIEK